MSSNTALIVIDLQEEYYDEGRPWYVPDGPRVLENTKRLLEAARDSGAEVVHVRHVNPDPDAEVFALGSEYTEIIDEVDVRDGEPLITKTKPGSFQNTELDSILTRRGVENVVLCGLLSFICVDTTAREADARGYNPLYVRDATAAFPAAGYDPEELTEMVAAIQDVMFSEVVTTDEAAERLE